jgi:hypothetical protein
VATVPISPFVRFAIMGAATVFSNWDTIRGLFDRAVETGTAPIYGYYSQHVFEMKDYVGAFTSRERGMYGVHWLNTTGGDLDATWTTADFAAVEAAQESYWAGEAAFISNDYRLVEHRWYSYGPGVVAPNPPARVTTIATPKVGSNATGGPHQVASTGTMRTPLRRHWGRVYLPFAAAAFGVYGQMTTAQVTARATAFRNSMLGASSSQGVVPVVWDRNRKVALGVTAFEMDAVPDIIRRRRPRTSAARTILSV